MLSQIASLSPSRVAHARGVAHARATPEASVVLTLVPPPVYCSLPASAVVAAAHPLKTVEPLRWRCTGCVWCG
jgi:hypothetical protein